MGTNVIIQHHGEARGFEPTEDEQRIFDIVYELTEEPRLLFLKKSDNYKSISIGPTDVCRFKFTKRAKWIQLPYVLDDKVRIQEPDDIRELKDDLLKAVDFAKNCK